LNIFGNYSYADVSQSRKSVLSRNITTPNQISSIDVDYFTRTHRFNHSYRGGVDYSLNARNTLGMMVSGADTRLNIEKRNESDIYSGGTPESIILTNSDQSRNIHNISFNLNYKAVLGRKKNELSADASLALYHRTSAEDMYSDYQYLRMKTMMMPAKAHLLNSSPARYNIKSAKADYLMPLSSADKITAGVKTSNVISNSNLDFGRMTDAGYVPNAMLTNEFHFDELINSLYMNYSRSTKTITFQVGLRAEHTISKGNSLTGGDIISRKYLDLFPNISLSKNFSQSHELALSFSRRLDRPAYQDLNPFLGYLDQYSYSAGNPLLSPQYSNNLEATHTFKKQFSTTLRYSVTHDAFSSVYRQNDMSRMIIQLRQNLDEMYAWGMAFNAPFTVTSWWTSNMNISAMNIHYKSSSNGGTLDNGKPDITIKALQSLNFHNGLSAEVSAKYQSPSFYGIMNYRQVYNVDFGISKSLFNKHGSVKLSAIDVLNTDHTASYSNYQNLDIHGDDKLESRMAILSFNWAFGKSTVGSFHKQSASSEAEQNRVGNL
jgi:outer membrane receptor protein involved in Fe transport